MNNESIIIIRQVLHFGKVLRDEVDKNKKQIFIKDHVKPMERLVTKQRRVANINITFG